MNTVPVYTTKNSFCKKCKLYERAKSPCIVGRGNINSKILLLGECPGRLEDDQGQVFIGKSGQYLQYVLDSIGFDCFISNSVLCRPVDSSGGNKTPTPTEIECCKPFTIDLIRIMKPKVIIAVGKIALQQLLKLNISMEAARGREFYHPELKVTIIPTYHPAYLMRVQDTKYNDEFFSDFMLAKKVSERAPSRIIDSVPRSIKGAQEIEEYLESTLAVPAIAIDLETTSSNPRTCHITDISFCCEIGKGVHIEWERIIENPRATVLLRELLESNILKVFHNSDFDIRCFRAAGFIVAKPIFDTMLAYHTLTMTFRRGTAASLYKLKTMAWFLTNQGGYESILDDYGGIVGIQKLQGTTVAQKLEKNILFDEKEIAAIANIDYDLDQCLLFKSREVDELKKARMDKLRIAPKEFYSAMDSDVTFRIYKYLKIFIDKDFSYPFYEIIMPLSYALLRIHENGIKVDVAHIEKVMAENNTKAENIKQKFFKKIGTTFNINSTDQLRDVIYNKLGAPRNDKFLTKKGKLPSTDEDAIKFYSEQIPVLKLIVDYREVQKQTSTYLEGYKKLVDKNYRVYPNYLQIGTVTGRVSASSPNLQNIPRDNRIRNMIIPEDGYKLVVADLSQVELRVLAMLSGDAGMIKAFESGHDFHMYTACAMFDIPIDQFDKENPKHNEFRSSAKVVNFGMVYQQRAETMAENLGITLKKALDFHKRFYAAYPKVGEWMEYTKAFVQQHGYVETLYGRRRYIPNINSSNRYTKAEAERQAINSPVQGSAGDICFFGLIRFQDWLDENCKKTKMVGTVHDSILAEVPFNDPNEIDEVCSVLPKLMTEDIPKVTIALKADLDVLDRWEK